MTEKVFPVNFKRLDSIVEDDRFRQIKHDPVTVRRHDHFTQINPETGGIPISDRCFADRTEDDHISLCFQNPFFFDGGYFQPFAGFQLLFQYPALCIDFSRNVRQDQLKQLPGERQQNDHKDHDQRLAEHG